MISIIGSCTPRIASTFYLPEKYINPVQLLYNNHISDLLYAEFVLLERIIEHNPNTRADKLFQVLMIYTTSMM